jgi:hypothetical protein
MFLNVRFKYNIIKYFLMSIKDSILGPHDDYFIIKMKGIIDLQQLYADVMQWYKNHGYETWDLDHKTKAMPPTGREEEIVITGYKNEDDYSRWWMYVRFDIWDSIPVEVLKDGKQVTMYRCRLRVKFNPEFEFDYENKFESTALLRGLRSFYWSAIIKRKYQSEGDKFEYELAELQDLIKRTIGMYSHGNQYANFWKV